MWRFAGSIIRKESCGRKDEVVVGPYDKEELKLFDVILFRQTDRYVL